MIRYSRRLVGAFAALSLAVLANAAAANLAGATTSNLAGGYDISWPQCPSNFPTTPAFGIAGVNDGRPFTANPCLGGTTSGEYAWAVAATGEPAQLYVNSADPGPSSPNWDQGLGQSTPYGTCAHNNDAACAYEYGINAATYAVGLAPAGALGLNWWIDVETANSWLHDTTANIADIQGMIAGFSASGVTGTVGIYTNSSSWNRITGDTQDFAGATYPAWFPTGSSSSAVAASDCTTVTAPSGGTIVMTQYSLNGYDGDYYC